MQEVLIWKAIFRGMFWLKCFVTFLQWFFEILPSLFDIFFNPIFTPSEAQIREKLQALNTLTILIFTENLPGYFFFKVKLSLFYKNNNSTVKKITSFLILKKALSF